MAEFNKINEASSVLENWCTAFFNCQMACLSKEKENFGRNKVTNLQKRNLKNL
jgi:hypothetical protein